MPAMRAHLAGCSACRDDHDSLLALAALYTITAGREPAHAADATGHDHARHRIPPASCTNSLASQGTQARHGEQSENPKLLISLDRDKNRLIAGD
jgi:hypothetical protein